MEKKAEQSSEDCGQGNTRMDGVTRYTTNDVVHTS
jgi:hypothetical protein